MWTRSETLMTKFLKFGSTGIDPAGPNFARRPRNARLDATDARFVDVIHTSLYGIKQPCGHVDFYVNWRIRQPGCIIEGKLPGVLQSRRCHKAVVPVGC